MATPALEVSASIGSTIANSSIGNGIGIGNHVAVRFQCRRRRSASTSTAATTTTAEQNE
jgi:hypothetical protein